MKIPRFLWVLGVFYITSAVGAPVYDSFKFKPNMNLAEAHEFSPVYTGKWCACKDGNGQKWYKIAHSYPSENEPECYQSDQQNCPASYNIANADIRLYKNNPTTNEVEIPVKKACDGNGQNCEEETFLGYRHRSTYPIKAKQNETDTWGFLNDPSFTTSNTYDAYAWWRGVNAKTKLNITWDPGRGTGTHEPTECIYGAEGSPGCQILPANTFSAPSSGKYFDGWACYSGGTTNCYITRYLPQGFDDPSVMGAHTITAVNTSDTDPEWDDDIGGTVPSTLATAYTGKNDIKLTAMWAPHQVTFKCLPYSRSPFVGGGTTSITKYKNANGQGATDIVYGSEIPLKTNIGDICKSPYYYYDENHYYATGQKNEKWCEESLKDDSPSVYSIIGSNELGSDFCRRSMDGYTMRYLCPEDADANLRGSCKVPSIDYECGNFDEGGNVQGIPPEEYPTEYQRPSNGSWAVSSSPSHYRGTMYVDERNRPMPAKPYPNGGGLCSTATLTHTQHQYYVVGQGNNNEPGNGCCIPPTYSDKTAVFTGWRANSGSQVLTKQGGWVNGTTSDDAWLLKPNEYGKGSPATNGNTTCNLSTMNNTITPNTWNPGAGCNLWPWARNVTLTAEWDYADIVVTLNTTNVGNATALLPNQSTTLHLDYKEGFYTGYTPTVETPVFTPHSFTGLVSSGLSAVPSRGAGYIFSGYYWCPNNSNSCDNPVKIIDAQGHFTSTVTINGETKPTTEFTKVDAELYPHWDCDTANGYVDNNGTCEQKTYEVQVKCNSSDNPRPLGNALTYNQTLSYNENQLTTKCTGVTACSTGSIQDGWSIWLPDQTSPAVLQVSFPHSIAGGITYGEATPITFVPNCIGAYRAVFQCKPSNDVYLELSNSGYTGSNMYQITGNVKTYSNLSIGSTFLIPAVAYNGETVPATGCRLTLQDGENG
ncbi:MAG: hypothetical protein J6T57_02345, partial [Alphaproteobacteria bacterium]|nr:hypothetical protein [Alphaproteobacteria bacterium]